MMRNKHAQVVKRRCSRQTASGSRTWCGSRLGQPYPSRRATGVQGPGEAACHADGRDYLCGGGHGTEHEVRVRRPGRYIGTLWSKSQTRGRTQSMWWPGKTLRARLLRPLGIPRPGRPTGTRRGVDYTGPCSRPNHVQAPSHGGGQGNRRRAVVHTPPPLAVALERSKRRAVITQRDRSRHVGTAASHPAHSRRRRRRRSRSRSRRSAVGQSRGGWTATRPASTSPAVTMIA